MASEHNRTLRTPPCNIDAEKALLGAIILKPDVMHDISVTVYPESFYADKHSNIYRAISSIFSGGDPIDTVSVVTKLKDMNQLERVGGASYVTELIETVPAAGNAMYYATQVQNKSTLRNLIHAADDIAEIGYSDPESVDEALDQAEKKIFQATQAPSAQKFRPIGSALQEAWERFEHLSENPQDKRGVPSGFAALDNILAGFQKSDLVILAARPSIGKSGLALDIARYIGVNEKKPVGLFSLEMSKDQIIDRFIASQSNVDLWKLRTGHLSGEGPENDFERIQHALGVLSEAPIFIDDTAGINIMQMRAMARRLQVQHGLGLLIVDYLQLMEPRIANMQMVQQMTEISRSLKGLAKELAVPVLALSQLSRAVESRPDQRPRLADLRESGSIEQDADVVMFIYREDKTKKDSPRPNIADIIISKHRNGPIGQVELYFNESQVSFKNLERHFNE